jgi:hypothetical protein
MSFIGARIAVYLIRRHLSIEKRQALLPLVAPYVGTRCSSLLADGFDAAGAGEGGDRRPEHDPEKERPAFGNGHVGRQKGQRMSALPPTTAYKF